MFTNITHLLCGTDFDEKDIGEATDIYDIPSVTGAWVSNNIFPFHYFISYMLPI